MWRRGSRHVPDFAVNPNAKSKSNRVAATAGVPSSLVDRPARVATGRVGFIAVVLDEER
jgi:hypothetical protein